jgi:hypothetical protein
LHSDDEGSIPFGSTMKTILDKINDIEDYLKSSVEGYNLSECGRVNPTIIYSAIDQLGELRTLAENYKCIHKLTDEWANQPLEHEINSGKQNESQCTHEWKKVDSQNLSKKRADVICVKCGCTGEIDLETGDVDWTTT